MATINVRQLDEGVVERLKRRAADNNRSLESEVRHILEQAAENDMAEKRKKFLDLLQRLGKQEESRHQIPAEDLIREDRDNDHRTK